ncbi:MAG: hypothetical protein Kow0074_13660 [Candidatus Zixiibacteriota bacterium]
MPLVVGADLGNGHAVRPAYTIHKASQYTPLFFETAAGGKAKFEANAPDHQIIESSGIDRTVGMNVNTRT